MAFRFLHTGDWHIGKPFGRFDDETAPLLRNARLEAVGRIAAAARARGISHVVVAGDVYDQPGLADSALRKLIERLRANQDVIWHMLPGNHDPARDDGVWQRLAAFGLPENVHVHAEPTVTEISPGVDLLAAPCSSHQMAADPTQWMDEAPRRDGAFRIGLAHGPVHGFGGEETPSGMIRPSRRESAGLDYLALGDWHGAKEIAPGVWYAGTPEPDQFPDNEPGFVLGVELEAPGALPKVERIEIAQYHWYRRKYEASDMMDAAAIIEDLKSLDGDPERCLLRVYVEGEISLSEDAALRAQLEELAPAFLHLDARLDKLSIPIDATVGNDLGAAHFAPLIERLMAHRADCKPQPGHQLPKEAEIAQRSLQLLARYSRAISRRVS